ncbi:MAG TPA: PAS domain S-box protein, partial [Chryseolinea sp.]|nr:PAS domain S-box protein [Chryseolinea sp.]
VLGKHISIFYTSEDRARNLPQQLINEATTTGRAGHEGWRVRKDGTLFWGSISITALHDDRGYVIGYAKVTRDLTERRQAEEELKQKHEALKISEQRYHLMISEVQDYAIILLDRDGIVLNWNKGAQHIKQYREDEIVGKHFRIFYLEEDQRNKLPERLIKEAAQRGKATHEGWRQRKDGSHFWGSIVITALHDQSGNFIGFSKVTRDLTERKKSEDQIFQYTQKLELQNKELEQFAYVASHDLQEPLRKIQTFADLVQKNIDNGPMVVKYLDKIDVSSARMSQLVSSLLGYSRLSALEGEKVDVDLNAILCQVETDFELLITEKKATIISDTLPTVRGHAMQLSQLFGNLIGNALKFNHGVPVISITFRLVSKDEAYVAENLTHPKYIELAFKDNGIGFEQKYAAKIFTIFQRLHDRMTFQGTGIGLALCKKIMENHDGAISCQSEPGNGATFYAYFPNH